MEFKFDYQAAIQQLKDMIAIDFMASLAPDEKTKKSVYEIMGVFVKNGVPVETAMKIISDFGDMFNSKEDKYL